MRRAILYCALAVFVAAAAMPFVSFNPKKASAASYDVTAKVPAPLPNEVPEITNFPADSTVASQTIEITGTCTVIVPALIVELVRDGDVIGTTVCRPDGTFSITVTLVLGLNIITPRFRTITGEYGSNGVPIILNYLRPDTSGPPSIGSPGAGSGPVRTNAPQPTAKPLSIKREGSFLVFSPGQPLELNFSIEGGTPQYTVLVTWGDGSVVKIVRSEAADISLNHTYKKPQFATIEIKLTDSTRQVVIMDVAAVTYSVSSGLSPVNHAGNGIGFPQLWWLYAVLLLGPIGWVIAYRVGLKKPVPVTLAKDRSSQKNSGQGP